MSDNRGVELLKKLFEKFKAFLFSKDALIFLFFLLLSFSFWFANALNKNREANIYIPVRYSELPKDVVIANDIPYELKVNVRDEGLNLFAYTRKKILPLNIELPQAGIQNGYAKITSDQILNRLSHHLRPTTTILGFSPDSIAVQFEKLSQVSLPVALDIDIELEQQYFLNDSIKPQPAYITVYGNKDAIDTLSQVCTEHISLKHVKDSIIITSKLIQPQGTVLSSDYVQLAVHVENFTEQTVTIPVTFINVPQGYTIRSFPAEIEVKYHIGISQYNKAHDNIRALIDYKDILSNKQETQAVKVMNTPSKAFNVRTVPEEVKFTLEEQNSEQE